MIRCDLKNDVRFRRLVRFGALAACASWLLLFTGCSRSEKVKLTGTVTWKGQPLSEGYISFTSNERGGGGGGGIQGGKYSLMIKPGEKSVSIVAITSAARPIDQMDLPIEQPIPAKYNSKTELKRTVIDEDETTLDFDLMPDTKKK